MALQAERARQPEVPLLRQIPGEDADLQRYSQRLQSETLISETVNIRSQAQAQTSLLMISIDSLG